MTKEEATHIVDALIDASELACLTDNSASIPKAQGLRDNLRDYIISELSVSAKATVYREPAILLVDDNHEGNHEPVPCKWNHGPVTCNSSSLSDGS